MSTYGGDSWAREALHRKRRVDELLLSSAAGASAGSPSPSFTRVANGKLACLVCPHRPIFDTPLMLSMHNKSSRHVAAEAKAREKELSRQAEISKRIALSSNSPSLSSTSSIHKAKPREAQDKPLIEQTRSAVLEAQSCKFRELVSSKEVHNTTAIVGGSSHCLERHVSGKGISTKPNLNTSASDQTSSSGTVMHNKTVTDCQELLKRREKELKFSSSGWKRDCHGKWYRDENVEFDSDNEDPNECFL